MGETLPDIDIRILNQVQQDCSLSTGELAQKVGLSQSPCWRRLQRLKDEGYIARQVAILDREKFAHSIVIFATLKMGNLTEAQQSDLQDTVNACEQIVECYTMFGGRDLMFKVLAPSMEWYQEFIFGTLLKLPGVQDVQSLMTLKEMKNTTVIPVKTA